jgi:hypothetical protein
MAAAVAKVLVLAPSIQQSEQGGVTKLPAGTPLLLMQPADHSLQQWFYGTPMMPTVLLYHRDNVLHYHARYPVVVQAFAFLASKFLFLRNAAFLSTIALYP